jgi:hypothetical protein
VPTGLVDPLVSSPTSVLAHSADERLLVAWAVPV